MNIEHPGRKEVPGKVSETIGIAILAETLVQHLSLFHGLELCARVLNGRPHFIYHLPLYSRL